MLNCLITEKAFSFMLHKTMPIRLWIHSYTVWPTCLQQYHRLVSPSQPQAQTLILKVSKASSRGAFATSKNVLHLFRFSFLAAARQIWRKTPHWGINQAVLAESKMLIRGKGSFGVQPCMVCQNINLLPLFTDFRFHWKGVPSFGQVKWKCLSSKR